jgi:hypothetical protein
MFEDIDLVQREYKTQAERPDGDDQEKSPAVGLTGAHGWLDWAGSRSTRNCRPAGKVIG